jgi:hypothetical membrane protein
VSRQTPEGIVLHRATAHEARQATAERITGTLMGLAGTAILMGIITGETLYPAPYRTSGNTISDLGGTRPPNGVVLQPSAAIFDATMIAAGVLIIAAAGFGSRASVRRLVMAPLALLGLGVLGVGLFPGNTQPHPLFAMLAFWAGGLAALLCWWAIAGWFRYLAAGLGLVALTALVLATFALDWGPVAELGEGGIERWIAYPVVLWLVAFGGYLLGRADVERP